MADEEAFVVGECKEHLGSKYKRGTRYGTCDKRNKNGKRPKYTVLLTRSDYTLSVPPVVNLWHFEALLWLATTTNTMGL